MSADSIKFIRKYKENELNDFPDMYGHSDTNPDCLNDAFWIASKMLRNCGYKLKESKILLMTDNATPFQHDSGEERNAFKKAEDLRDSGITVALVPMSDSFSGEPFYSQFISTVYDTDLSEIHDDLKNPSQLRANLLTRAFQKEFTKRCNSRIKFHFGQGLDMSVGIYSMYREAKPPKKVLLKRSDNEMVQAKRVPTVVQEDEELDHQSDGQSNVSTNVQPNAQPNIQTNTIHPVNLMPTEMKKYQEVGFEKIAFSMDEFTKMKRVREPGIVLLGFKPRSSFVVAAHLRGPNFMYPDETTLKGSTTLFTALWERCLHHDKVAYAILVERNFANPKLVVLVPQDEANGKFKRYGGFRIEYIPYADSIRDVEAINDQPPSEIPENSITLFKKLIEKLRFRYNPLKFSSPVVRGRYDVIEATVLEETPPEFNDTTLPDTETQDKNIAELIEIFQGLFDADTADKRSATGSTGSRAPKIAKIFDPKEIEAAYNNNTLNSFTNDNLKAYLSEKKVTGLSKLKKSDLIAKVQEIIEDQVLSIVKLS